MPTPDLGKPGVSNANGEAHPDAPTHVLGLDEDIRFVDDHGLVEVTHRGRTFREGDLIIGNDTQRLLLRVKKVVKQGTDRSELETKLGLVSDLLNRDKDTVIRIESTPKVVPADLPVVAKGSGLTVDEGGRVSIKNMEIFDLQFDEQAGLKIGLNRVLGVPVTGLGDKVKVSGIGAGRYRAVLNEGVVHVVPTFRGDYRWQGLRPKELRSRIDASLKYKLDITYEIAAKADLSVEIDLFKKKKIPLRVPGPVPMYVDVELGIPLGLNLSADGKGRLRVIYEAEYAFVSDLRYSEAEGVKTTGNQGARVIRHELIGETEGDAKLAGEIFLQPTVEAKIYRVLGPNTYLQPYVRGEWQKPEPAGKDDLFVGVGGGVGLQVAEPVLLTQLFSLDSGRIFDFKAAWDLLPGTAGRAEPVPYEVLGQQKVSRLTDEGFVVLDFSSGSLPPGTRFAIKELPTRGFVVQSQRFFSDGKIFYYPSADTAEDRLKVAFLLPDRREDVREIKLGVSEEARAQAGADRFSRAANSVSAAYGHPADFQQKVDHYRFVTAGLRAEVIEPARLKDLQQPLKFGNTKKLEERVAANPGEPAVLADGSGSRHQILFDEEFAGHQGLGRRGGVAMKCVFRMADKMIAVSENGSDSACFGFFSGGKTANPYDHREYTQTYGATPILHSFSDRSTGRGPILRLARIGSDGSLVPVEFRVSESNYWMAAEQFEPGVDYLVYFEANPKWRGGAFFAEAGVLRAEGTPHSDAVN